MSNNSGNGPQDSTSFSLGPWHVQPSRNLMTGEVGDVQLTHKCMEVLCLLARAEGDVLTRQDLMQRVWTDTIVNEESLTRIISDLRRALCDDRACPRYIETIPKRGYRLVAEVIWAPQTDAHPGSAPSPSPVTGGRAEPVVKRRRWLFVTAAVLAVLAMTALTKVRFWSQPTELPSGMDILRTIPLTSDPGFDAFPAFSADGSRVAYSRRASDSDPYHIFIKQPRQAQELQLTDGPFSDKYPTWSADGGVLAFVRRHGDEQQICLVPSLGGPVQVIHRLEGRCRGLDWSPDGAHLAIGHAPLGGRFSILMLDVAQQIVEPLTPSLTEGWGDLRPRFSPTGDRVAFIRNLELGEHVVCVVTLDGRAVTRLSNSLNVFSDLDWYPDGRYLAVSAWRDGRFGLWRLDVESEEQMSIPLPVESVSGLSICPTTGTVVAQIPRMDVDLMRYDLDFETTRKADAGSDLPLTGQAVFRSTRSDYLPTLDPTGRQLAFCSTRTGEPQLYVADVQSGQVRPVTDHVGVGIGALCWSPDGTRLLVTGQDSQGWTFLGFVDPINGQLHTLPLDFVDYSKPAWTRDGRWIYFNGKCSAGWRLHRIRPDGTDLTRVRDGGSVEVVHAGGPDGPSYFLDSRHAGLHRLDPDGTEYVVADYPAPPRIPSIGSMGERIYYVAYLESRPHLIKHDLATARQETLGTVAGRCRGPLALFPDEKALFISTTLTTSSDLVIVPRLH